MTAAGTWVLLRGLTREAGHWGAFPDLLRPRLPANARIVALDLPGNGRLNQVRSPAQIEAIMQSCRQQLQALGMPRPYHLLAMSLGAMVAVEWASQHPVELAGCVLVNTSLRPFSPWYRRLRPCNYGTLLGVALGRQSPRAQEQAILRLTTRHPPQPEAVLAQWCALRAAYPVSRGNAVRQLLAAARYRAPMARPPVPLLVLIGGRDALVDPRCSRRLAQQWGLPTAEHATAGHDLPLDDGPWVARQAARWAAGAG